MVLQDEVRRVLPVVRDVRADVITHHVRMALGRLRLAQHLFSYGDEAIHFPAVYVRLERGFRVGVVAIAVVVIDPWLAAATVSRVLDANPGRDPVGAREGTEVGVEGPVLLHDHDDVLDLVDVRVDLNGSVVPGFGICRSGHAEGDGTRDSQNRRHRNSADLHPVPPYAGSSDRRTGFAHERVRCRDGGSYVGTRMWYGRARRRESTHKGDASNASAVDQRPTP